MSKNPFRTGTVRSAISIMPMLPHIGHGSKRNGALPWGSRNWRSSVFANCMRVIAPLDFFWGGGGPEVRWDARRTTFGARIIAKPNRPKDGCRRPPRSLENSSSDPSTRGWFTSGDSVNPRPPANCASFRLTTLFAAVFVAEIPSPRSSLTPEPLRPALRKMRLLPYARVYVGDAPARRWIWPAAPVFAPFGGAPGPFPRKKRLRDARAGMFLSVCDWELPES